MTSTFRSKSGRSGRRLIDVSEEHVLSVVGCVTARVPEVEVEEVGCDHFTVAPLRILFADHLYQSVCTYRYNIVMITSV